MEEIKELPKGITEEDMCLSVEEDCEGFEEGEE